MTETGQEHNDDRDQQEWGRHFWKGPTFGHHTPNHDDEGHGKENQDNLLLERESQVLFFWRIHGPHCIKLRLIFVSVWEWWVLLNLPCVPVQVEKQTDDGNSEPDNPASHPLSKLRPGSVRSDNHLEWVNNWEGRPNRRSQEDGPDNDNRVIAHCNKDWGEDWVEGHRLFFNPTQRSPKGQQNCDHEDKDKFLPLGFLR